MCAHITFIISYHLIDILCTLFLDTKHFRTHQIQLNSIEQFEKFFFSFFFILLQHHQTHSLCRYPTILYKVLLISACIQSIYVLLVLQLGPYQISNTQIELYNVKNVFDRKNFKSPFPLSAITLALNPSREVRIC